MTENIQRAQKCARFFRTIGYNPLPSKVAAKAPAMTTFAEFWEQDLPDSVFDSWAAPNIQIMCGARWKLCVVDCDGRRAIATWGRMLAHFGHIPPTWVSRTGGGGLHYWFTLPDATPCPSRRLWGVWDAWQGSQHRGDWLKHKEIRLLADKALVVAPPSLHVDTGVRYAFVDNLSPKRYPRPAAAPDWLLAMPGIEPPSARPVVVARPIAPPKRERGPNDHQHDRQAVLDAIGDKLAIAAGEWKLRVASHAPNPSGWISCHAIGRDDRRPSASFHVESGSYWEGREQESLSFFDLGVALGQFSDWQACCNALGDRFSHKNSRMGSSLKEPAP